MRIELPQRHLDTACDGLLELAQRLELEAVAFAGVNLQEAAADRLERAKAVQEAANFFLHL